MEFAFNTTRSDTTYYALFVATCGYLLQISFNATASQSTGTTTCKYITYRKT